MLAIGWIWPEGHSLLAPGFLDAPFQAHLPVIL